MIDSRVAAGKKPGAAKKNLPYKGGSAKKDNMIMTKGKLQGMKKVTVAKKTAVSKPADFKKANFNMAINVPESAIQKLRAGKTKSNNVKTYKGTKSAVMKEAMNRFYGKGWDGSTSNAPGRVKDAPVGPKSTAPKKKPGSSYPNLPPAPNGKGEWQFNSKTGKWEPLKRPSIRKTGRGN